MSSAFYFANSFAHYSEQFLKPFRNKIPVMIGILILNGWRSDSWFWILHKAFAKKNALLTTPYFQIIKKLPNWFANCSFISWERCTGGKVSVFGVILVRIQSKCGKMQTRITPNRDTPYTVLTLSGLWTTWMLLVSLRLEGDENKCNK